MEFDEIIGDGLTNDSADDGGIFGLDSKTLPQRRIRHRFSVDVLQHAVLIADLQSFFGGEFLKGLSSQQHDFEIVAVYVELGRGKVCFFRT